MNKETMLGQVRAVLTAIGGILTTYGLIGDHDYMPAVGVAVLLFSVVWSLTHHEGRDAAVSILRKLVNATAAAAVTYGMMTPGKAEAIAVLVLNVLVFYGSWRSNGGQPPAPGKTVPVLLVWLAAISLMGLPSCTVTIDPATGKPVVGADQATIQAITAEVLDEINEELRTATK